MNITGLIMLNVKHDYFKNSSLNYNWMEQLSFRYKKFSVSYNFQEKYIGFHKT